MTVSGFRPGGCGSHRPGRSFSGSSPGMVLQDLGADSPCPSSSSNQVISWFHWKQAQDLREWGYQAALRWRRGIRVGRCGGASRFHRDVFGVPCLLRADDYARNGHVQVVDVVKVAPVGDQHALRMVCAP